MWLHSWHIQILLGYQCGYNGGSRKVFLKNSQGSNDCGVCMCVDFVEENKNLTDVKKLANPNGGRNGHWGKMS